MRPYRRVFDWMRSVTLAASLKSRIRPSGLFVAVVLVFATYASINETYGQSCRPAILRYIVRDEKGRNLSEAELQNINKEMAQPADGVSTISLSKDGKLSVGSTEATEAKARLSALSYVDAKTCELNVREVTLQYAGKTMRLIFNMIISRKVVVIDSLPFQGGTFRLDLQATSKDDPKRVIPAKRWKRIKDNP